MVVLVAHMHVHAHKVDEALAACRAVRTPTLAEPGVTEYDFFQSPDDPAHIVFVETWESREALEAHFGTPHFAEFFGHVPQLAARPPVINVYGVSGVETL